MLRSKATAAVGTVPVIALALALVGALAACDDFDGWDYSVFDVAQTAAPDASCPACDCGGAPPADVSGETTGTCLDCLTSLTGRAMRFKRLTVTEPIVPTAPTPEALPQFLNGIWQEDVRRYILNIMLQVQAVDVETRTLTLVGGAAWHDLEFQDLPVAPGDPVTQVPSEYTLLAGLSAPFTVQLDQACGFTLTSDPPTVGFHPGPEDIPGMADHPTICTSEGSEVIQTANSIPIVDLRPTGTINASCTGVVSGTLRGCIARDAADRICSWGPAPDYSDWYYTPNEDWPDTPRTPDFCKRWCGTTPPANRVSAWVNFGGFVSVIGVPLECDSDGDGVNDGYAIAGDFEAEIVDIAP